MRLKAVPRCRGGSVNDLAPKVVRMRSLGRSKTILEFDLNEYAEQDLTAHLPIP